MIYIRIKKERTNKMGVVVNVFDKKNLSYERIYPLRATRKKYGDVKISDDASLTTGEFNGIVLTPSAVHKLNDEIYDWVTNQIGIYNIKDKVENDMFDKNTKNEQTVDSDKVVFNGRIYVNGEDLYSRAVGRVITVSNDEARLALTKEDARNGDTVIDEETGLMYLVKDDSLLGDLFTAEDAFVEYSSSKFGDLTLGSNNQFVYLTNGQIQPTYATIGSATQPVYMNQGIVKPIDATVGSTSTPVYLNNGVITACGNELGRVMTGATSSKDGASGLVVAPKKGNWFQFLRGDATWQDVVTPGDFMEFQWNVYPVDGSFSLGSPERPWGNVYANNFWGIVSQSTASQNLFATLTFTGDVTCNAADMFEKDDDGGFLPNDTSDPREITIKTSIKAKTITGDKIADGAITLQHLGDGAVTSDKLAAKAVTNQVIDPSVGTVYVGENEPTYGHMKLWIKTKTTN